MPSANTPVFKDHGSWKVPATRALPQAARRGEHVETCHSGNKRRAVAYFAEGDDGSIAEEFSSDTGAVISGRRGLFR